MPSPSTGHIPKLAKPEQRQGGLPFKSVDTPVAKRPFDATAREPPRSTVQEVRQWIFHGDTLQGKDQRAHAGDCSTMEGSETVLADVRMTFEY